MRTFQLQLKPRTTPLPRLAEAWFIPSTQPRTWLYEAIACQLPLAQLRIHIVPKSTHDLTPSGALLVSTQPFTAGKTCAATPCDKIGNGKLYFPHGAALHPPVTSAELDRALPSPHYFLHPSLGLTAFDTEATLGVMDLIAPPTEIASDWSHSHPGRPTLPRLTSVSLTLSESLEDILGSGREDIGSLDKGTMPKHPSETGLSDKLSHAGGLLGKGVAGIAGIAGAAGALAAGGLLKGMLNFANNTPQTANKRTWVNFLQEWAEKKLANVKFMPQQEKEIERLLHLLETNPDEGLKYALPLNADNARGAGDSSGHLSQHATDFDLRNLGGGQSYSPWDLSWQAQQK